MTINLYENDTQPAIYVACLASYNNGISHGKWINDLSDAEQVRSDIKNILATSPIADAVEWEIHDYDNFGDIDLLEYSDIDYICELASLIDEHGEIFTEVYADVGCLQKAKRMIEENYMGCYDTIEDYAEQYIQECYNLPNDISFYLDYKRFARDLEVDLNVINMGGEIHVFTNH